MTDTFPLDPTRRVINVADPRLNRILLREPERCATIGEYAKASGIDADRVIDLLGPFLDDGTLRLEIVGDEVFVHTGPGGRPQPAGHAEVSPNLWEHLRENAGTDLGYSLWKLLRQLEWAGWRVEARPSRILFGMSKLLRDAPHLGVVVANQVIPLLIFPSADELAMPNGLLSEYSHAGARSVGVVCGPGALEDMVTASRRWLVAHAKLSAMGVIVLEGPRFNPTLLAPGDAVVRPIAVAQMTLQHLSWD